MNEFIEFNKKYTDDTSKEYREKLSKLMFDIEYFSFRIQEKQKEAQAIRMEYLNYLGVKEDGQNEKK